MATVFLEERRRMEQGSVPVTLMLIEVLGEMQQAITEEDADVHATIQAAVVASGLIEEDEMLTPEQVVDLVLRMQPKEKTEEAPKENSQFGRSKKRVFGSDFLAKFDSWSLEDKCLYAAGFDYEYARRLYCEFDKSIVEKILGVRLGLDAAVNMTRFEAVVFGMGGSMGNTKEPAKDLGEITDFAPEKSSDDFYDAALAFQQMQHSFRGGSR